MASTTTLAPGLARKVKKILEIKTESPELLNSLATLSSFYTENTSAARRSLRTTIEKRGLEINQQFLTAAETVIQALDEVQGSLNALSESCGHITSRLAVSKTASSQLLAETDKLQKEWVNVEHRSQLVAEFLDQFQLTPEEVAALQADVVGPEFFKALERVRNIHENCRSLLRTHHQRAGLDLMDMMALHQDKAYERLCRWVQTECRSIGEFDAPEVEPNLQTAVRALRESPVLFKCCAEEVATARHNALFQRFITALTRGGPGGLPRPIEIHAHDPKRYVSDMLAWVHQALASEREFVSALFGDTPAAMMAGDADHGGDALDPAGLLDQVFESICRPLKVRVEQVLMSSPPLLLCFQLAQLLSFYSGMVVKILGPQAQLSSTLRTCKDMAQRIFLEQVRSRGEKLLRSIPPPPADLSPPPQIHEGIAQLQETLAAQDAALVPEGGEDTEVQPVVSAVLEPLVELCERSAEALQADAPSRVDESTRMDPARHSIYLINCFHAMHNALHGQAGASQQAQQLMAMIEAQVSALVSGEVTVLLGRCGLAEILERMRLYKTQADASRASSMAADPALYLHTVADALRSFFQLLSASDALPEFLQLQAPRLRADAVSRVASALAEAYEAVYSAVDDPTSGYGEQGAPAAVKHTPAQVRTILGVL